MWLLLLVAGAILPGAKISGPTEPKAVSILSSDLFQPRTRGPVYFRHSTHEAAGVSCTACHHDYVSGRNRWRPGLPVEKCQTCHREEPQAGKLDLKNAFHRQCKDCHLKSRQRGRMAGPVKCQECHGMS